MTNIDCNECIFIKKVKTLFIKQVFNKLLLKKVDKAAAAAAL